MVTPRVIGTCVVAMALIAGAYWIRTLQDAGRPSAVWRDGRIAEVKNCGTPRDDGQFLACAELVCQRAVALKLSKPDTAKISAGMRVDTDDIRYVRIVGTIDDAESASRRMPKGYECYLEGLQIHAARVIE
ncbi:MAG: hypothetical protein HYX63_11890 [Gammaproteobacteria bacterium]|nr:hypothetical protein [Gammaproteobacteria bacterium]